MPKLRFKRKGIRVSVWIPDRNKRTWGLIENKSKFVQLALDDASGIMAWGILRATDPEKFKKKTDDQDPAELSDEFNKHYPLDPLTANRLNRNENQQPWKPDDSPSLRNVL